MSHDPRLCPLCAEELLGRDIAGICFDCWKIEMEADRDPVEKPEEEEEEI